MKILVLVIVATWLICCRVSPAEEIPALRNYRTPNNSLWFKYYAAGEKTLANQDAARAKRYFQEALNALEKEAKPQETSPNHKDSFFLYRLSALEQRLVEGYPVDWSKQDEDAKLGLQQEQVEIYDRIARLNARFVDPRDMLATKGKERALAARERLSKTLAEKDPNAERKH